jgi:hypothetical protein
MSNTSNSVATLAIILALAAAAVVAPARAATCNVPSQYASITAAIAATGCTQIEVAAGTYKENLVITRGLAIHGAFAPTVVIDGNAASPAIKIDTPEAVSLAGLTVQNGRGQTNGGGVYISHGNVSISACRIVNNVAPANGGGVFSNQDGNKLTISDSLVSGNSTELYDGGGLNLGSGQYEVVNTTISGNRSQGNGGGVYITNPNVVHVRSCTISGNNGNLKASVNGRGGGLIDSSSANTVTFANTIMAGNLENGVATITSDCYSTDGDSLGYNLVGIADYCFRFKTTGDMTGTILAPLSAGLGALQRGAAEQVDTVPLFAGSLAIDHANPMGCFTAAGTLITTDARAVQRPRDGNGDGMAIADIGAYEKDGALLPTQVLYIPTSAHSTGTGGTNWRTDVEAQNPSTQQAGFKIELLKKDLDNTSPQATQTLQLDGGVAVRYPDALASLFQFDGTGAIRVTVTGVGLLVNSRTYNLLGDGNPLGLPAGATFGQFVPAYTLDQAANFGQTARLIHLSHTNANIQPVTGSRTNIGFVNMTGMTIDIVADLYDKTGALFGTIPGDLTRLLPYSFRQVNNAFERVTSAAVADGYAIIKTTTSGGKFVTYASVIDNRSGDPVFVTQIRM